MGPFSLTLLLSLYPMFGTLPQFIPSVEGKQILLMDGWTEMEDGVAIDGLLVGGPMIFYYPVTQEQVEKFVRSSRKRDWGRLRHNFWVCWSFAGQPGEFDWFDDFSMFLDNFRKAAAAVRDAGFKGLAFDSELYAGINLFRYGKWLKYHEQRSIEAYQDQAFQRGAEIMRGVREEYPDITIFFLFGGEPSKENPNRYRGLLGPFIDGFLSECGSGASVIDGNESSYYAATEADLMAHRQRITETKLACSRVPEKYRQYLKVGFGIWPDAGNKAGMTFDIERFQRNYRTPDELAYTLHHALRYTDQYVWLWRGDIHWLKKRVTVIDEHGKFVQKPLPASYVDALQRARDPELSLPTARGYGEAKAGMRGLVHAVELPGWSDTETFTDLWETYVEITALPKRWRFRRDPDDKGLSERWYAPDLDDGDWQEIQIGEFWEMQEESYKHYDGVGWYRVPLQLASLPDGRCYLVFGAVNDEAMVYVNGQQCRIVEEGRQGKRFLVDITDAIQTGSTHQIIVRVSEKDGLGGIWKHVKVVAR